jgi:glutathionylspermidine amidase/synthetase
LKFGDILGTTASGVACYNNGPPDFISHQTNLYQSQATGLKWQCVEFVRRYLMMTQGLTFLDVDYAYELWVNLHHYIPISHQQKQQELETIPLNQLTSFYPNDILIYGKNFRRTGHVAVILNQGHIKDHAQIAEQNFSENKWPSNYSRAISLNSELELLGVKRITSATNSAFSEF